MTENRYGDKPLGKSVEEIERESGNAVNSPVEGEAVRAGDAVLVPAVVNANTTTQTPAVIVNPEALVDTVGSGAEDGRATVNRDSSET